MQLNKKSHVARYVEEDQVYWEHHLSSFGTSGLTRKTYCKEHNVNYDRFGYWKKVLLGQPETTNKLIPKISKLVPVAIKTAKVSNEKGLCSVRFSNGCLLEVHDESVLPLLLSRMI